ncbi:MAG TPA: hypothetical protein VHH36_00035 [Candidatus Thermoplasmatota archaeon]|nr:hypothetical protein [Candidatus Thermoplasmatota archaeon]
MKPVLSSLPPMRRTLLFAPIALGAFLVAFLVAAFATDVVLVGLVVGAVAGPAAAWALVGWPVVARKDGRPLVDPRVKPWLFFLVAPLIALALYPILGTVFTAARLDPRYVAWASLAVCVPAGIGGAYALVGFPSLWSHARGAYSRVPTDRRPFLFFPLFVLFFIVIFLALGVATTQALAKGSDELLLDLQVLVLLPLSLALAGLGAYLLVGFPKPAKKPTDYLPKVTGRHRPQVFLLTFLVAGIPLSILCGVLLTWLATRYLRGMPAPLVLPLAFLLGYSLSLGVAALAWGTPARWRQYEDYRPGLHPRARTPLYVGVGVGLAAAITIAFGLAGGEIFWGLLVGSIVGLLVALQLAGLMARIAARRRAPTLVPDLPDGVKPLVIFPAWFLIFAVTFAVLTYAAPGLVLWNAIGAFVLGFLVSFLVIEEPLWKDLLADRRREREKRKAFEARRKEALARKLDERP